MSLTVAFLPVYPNPYQRLLAEALGGEGVAVDFLSGLPSPDWLRSHANDVAILHYHWLYGLYMARAATPVQVWRFVSRLRLAESLGYRIVWTAHNVLPHRAPFPPLHKTMRRLMMGRADAVITHCAAGRRELLARFPRRRPVEVIPHGHYGDVYRPTLSPEEARAQLGLAKSSFVYLSLGNIAAYKGLDNLAATFARTTGPEDVWLIAGRNRDGRLVQRLAQAAAHDTRIRIHAGEIPQNDMATYLTAANVMVAPFENILTSGSVIAALSLGLPVIVPALGCLPELVSPDAGIVYDPADPDALNQAMRSFKERDPAAMSVAARRITDSLGWDDIARRTAAVYRSCLAR